ncbi:MAG: YdcF family protein [Clostridia bacterium]|nr:YdcF family protein [Deltaproteobacteria bacterium]
MRTVIVVFGAASLSGGRLSDPLHRRLMRARAESIIHPDARIIVSGGPVKGPAEGPLMKRWLTTHGVDPSRIVVEKHARYTLDNARRVAPLLRPMRPTDIVMVTSASHMARSLALLEEEVRRTVHVAVRFHPSPAREGGSVVQIKARYRVEAEKTVRDLATQRRDRCIVLRPMFAGFQPRC